MATIDRYQILMDIIKGKYVEQGDPLPIAIYEYNNTFNRGVCWMVGFNQQDIDAMNSSPFVHNPRLVWTKESGVVGTITKPE